MHDRHVLAAFTTLRQHCFGRGLHLAVPMLAFLLVAHAAPSLSSDATPFSTGWHATARDAQQVTADLQTLSAIGGAGNEHLIVWVGLTDKGIASDTELTRALRETERALTPRGRARRAKVSNSALVDFVDVPVVERYVDAIGATGARVRVASRWLNAVSVEATPDELRAIAALPFVTRLTEVARQERRTFEPRPLDSGVQSGAGLDYGLSLGQLEEIQVTDAHTLGLSGAGVLVCMLDTGFLKDHETFQTAIGEGRLVDEWDFIQNDGNTQNEAGDSEFQHNHGTATWSALGGYSPGELIGPAYGALFMVCKTEDVEDEQPIEEDWYVAALERADTMGADIVSASLSYIAWYTTDDMDGATAVTTIGVDIAASRNILVVNSAGNQGGTDWNIIGAPADADSVLSIGAMNSEGELAGFSSRGPTADGRIKPEVCARGVETHCALASATDAYGDASGTSLSCPLVGGAAALVMEARPSWSAMQVRDALMLTAENAAMPDNDQGWGRIQVLDAINLTTGIAIDPPFEAPSAPVALMRVVPNPLVRYGSIDLTVPGERSARVKLRLYDVAGRLQRVVHEGVLTPGAHAISFDGGAAGARALAPGVYFLRAEIDGGTAAVVRTVVTR